MAGHSSSWATVRDLGLIAAASEDSRGRSVRVYHNGNRHRHYGLRTWGTSHHGQVGYWAFLLLTGFEGGLDAQHSAVRGHGCLWEDCGPALCGYWRSV